MKTISILRTDGCVSFRTVINDKAPIDKEIEAFNKEHVEDGFVAQEWKIIDPANIHPDRTFRGALTIDGKVDMRRAVELTKQRLRNERAPLLADLDVQYMRAIEAGDAGKQAAIVAEKQRLRDITKLAEHCNDTNQLKALKPC